MITEQSLYQWQIKHCKRENSQRGRRAKPIEAIAARNFLNEMIKGKKVSIRRVTEDKYGRTVGELSFNGENLQQLLVKEGHAEIYKKYSKPCKWAS